MTTSWPEWIPRSSLCCRCNIEAKLLFVRPLPEGWEVAYICRTEHWGRGHEIFYKIYKRLS